MIVSIAPQFTMSYICLVFSDNWAYVTLWQGEGGERRQSNKSQCYTCSQDMHWMVCCLWDFVESLKVILVSRCVQKQTISSMMMLWRQIYLTKIGLIFIVVRSKIEYEFVVFLQWPVGLQIFSLLLIWTSSKWFPSPLPCLYFFMTLYWFLLVLGFKLVRTCRNSVFESYF